MTWHGMASHGMAWLRMHGKTFSYIHFFPSAQADDSDLHFSSDSTSGTPPRRSFLAAVDSLPNKVTNRRSKLIVMVHLPIIVMLLLMGIVSRFRILLALSAASMTTNTTSKKRR
jgi:hypothetical protein